MCVCVCVCARVYVFVCVEGISQYGVLVCFFIIALGIIGTYTQSR